MVRRGPASVYRRKSSSKSIVEDCPDPSRPPPCMPDIDPAVWLSGAPFSRCGRRPSRPRSRSSHLRGVGLWELRYVTQFNGRRRLFRACRTARRGLQRPARAPDWPVDVAGETSSDVAVMAEVFAGGSDVMQAIDHTNPANSRAIAVTMTGVGLSFAMHMPIALAQAGLCLPGDRAHGLRHGGNGGQLAARDAGRETVAVCGLDQQGPGMNITTLGDGAGTALWDRRNVPTAPNRGKP